MLILFDYQQLALTSFYDADSEQPEVVHVESPRSEPEEDVAANNPAVKAKQKPRPKANSRFATLRTLEGSSSDEEEGQAFYAGGSENSGQQVLGPSKKKKDIVSEMFKSVQEYYNNNYHLQMILLTYISDME